MAPDIDTVNASGDEFTVANFEKIPNISLFDPRNRKLKVISIGAGIAGVLAGYKVQKHCKNVEHKIYERNADIGGTWFENRYPGVGCDIPSHAYTFGWAPNPDWPDYFSSAESIWDYLNRVCDCFDLRKLMSFHTNVDGCYWNESTGKWTVKMTQHFPGAEPTEIEDTCDVLLYGTGVLNDYKWPEISGMDKFKGKIIHTARWPSDYQKEQWEQENVAIIGSGASSIQTVASIQPHVKHMDIFVRTAVWFIQLAGKTGFRAAYTTEDLERFHKDPEALIQEAKKFENELNSLWAAFFKGSPEQDAIRGFFASYMAEQIKDERLLKGFTPTFGVGCRRCNLGGPYMEAIQQENVDVHFSVASALTEDGVVGEDGIERKVDTVICATGFDTSYRPRFPIVGRNGINLQDKWKLCPEGYMGMLVPEMPNFVMFMGPSWPIENGSIMGSLDAVANYTVQMINKIQADLIKSLSPRQDVTDKFNAHCQSLIQGTIWTDSCRSWYKNNETGRVNSIWPGSSLHYIQAIKQPRFEDFDIRYMNDENQWEYLGRGFTVNERTEGADHSPYLSVDLIDSKWREYASIGTQKA